MSKDNPSRTWVLTVNESKDSWLPTQEELIKFFSDICEDYAFQLEKGEESERQHYQCSLRLRKRKRKKTLITLTEKSFGDKTYCFQYERMYGTFAESVEYCIKNDTKIGESISTLPIYRGADINFLDESEKRYQWQNELLYELCLPGSLHYKTPHDRQIYWITDKRGCSGKSKFTKYMALRSTRCVKVPFGTASQMRSAVISLGPQTCYIIDVPRTLGQDDDITAVLSLVEDLKNGYLVSSMYGKAQLLMMAPPHVIIFSNSECPLGALSRDRWVWYTLHNNELKPGNYIPGPLEQIGVY